MKAARLVLSVPALGTALVPLIADTGSSHLSNPLWAPHARYHGALLVIDMLGLGCLSMALLWMRAWPEALVLRFRIVALIVGVCWGSFLVALLVPGASVWPDGANHEGMPVNPNVVMAVVFVAMAAFGGTKSSSAPS
jgi:hypothetical protein